MLKLPICLTPFQRISILNGIYLILLVFGLNQTSKAQSGLRFIDSSHQKVVTAYQGDYLILKYKGYLGQTEFYKHTLQGVSDSSLIVGIVHPYSPLSGVFIGTNNPWKEIKFRDIEAFKRRSAGANFLKSMIGISAGLSAILLLKNLNEDKKFSNGKNLAISLGVGIGINVGMNLIFSDKPKNKMQEGWHIETFK